MSSKSFLKIAGIANGDSTTKESDTLALLLDPSNDIEQIIHYINGLLKQHSLPIKQILSNFIDHVESNPSQRINRTLLYEEMVVLFTPPTNIVSLPLMKTIWNLSNIYESQSNFSKAVEALKNIHTDTLIQEFSTPIEFKKFQVELNTKIAKNSFKLNDLEDADAYITRIIPSLTDLQSIPEYSTLIIDSYQTSVQIMVKLGKWLEASSRLLSLNNESFDLETITYAILSTHTTYKLKLFDKIINSNHIIQNVQHTPLYEIFQKILNNNLIHYDEFHNCLNYLPTIITNKDISIGYVNESFIIAIVENNLKAASSFYSNTNVSQFAKLLNISESVVEEITADMIRDDRLDATIDDVDKIIEFENTTNDQFGLQQWDDHIVESCSIIDKIVQDITIVDKKLAFEFI